MAMGLSLGQLLLPLGPVLHKRNRRDGSTSCSFLRDYCCNQA
jgi:hypothetical protein